jgi:hypothetical protein
VGGGVPSQHTQALLVVESASLSGRICQITAPAQPAQTPASAGDFLPPQARPCPKLAAARGRHCWGRAGKTGHMACVDWLCQGPPPPPSSRLVAVQPRFRAGQGRARSGADSLWQAIQSSHSLPSEAMLSLLKQSTPSSPGTLVICLGPRLQICVAAVSHTIL